MNKKGMCLVLALFSFIFLLSLVSAANETTNTSSSTSSTSSFDKSFDCLKTQINNKGVGILTDEELSWSLLALGYDSEMNSKIKTELKARASNEECWPKSGCNLKDTSLAFLALDYVGEDISKIRSWLLNQTIVPSELVWYLQIDSNAEEKATCKITYDGTTKTVYVNQDKTVTGSAGACFRSAYNGFWLEIIPTCYDKEFQISCDKDFLTATHFRKKTSSTYYLSTTTQTAAIGGTTVAKVNSLCFKQNSNCNYEGSLWATMALNKKDSSLRDKILPYLMTSNTENERVFPSAFLYMITGYDDYFNDISNKQRKEGYWQISDTSRRYYDTGIALMSLYGKSTEQAQTGITYLLSPSVQGSGCWNGDSIRDTAMLLYASNPKSASSGGIAPRSQCTSFGHKCMFSLDCSRANGTQSDNFACSGVGSICCVGAQEVEKTCTQQGGLKCSINQECSTGFISASDTGLCCGSSGVCKEKTVVITNECEEQGTSYSCKSSCTSEESAEVYNCPNSQEICCFTPQAQKSFWWVWLLVILIILLVLAVIFRKQLELFIFKRKNISSTPVQQRPPFPPRGMMPGRMMPRPMPGMPFRPGMQRPMPPRPFPRDRELDATLKKLKDMSK